MTPLPVRPKRTEAMATRDGTRLVADIWQPEGPGPWPVLMMRQAYGRRIGTSLCYAPPEWYAARGYIVVMQDVRGRGESGGGFALFEHEAADGADSVAWAAALPGSNGRVGMFGFSFQGSNQLLAAGEPCPALKAIAPAMIGWDIRRDWAYENGAFALRANIGWATQLAAETARLAGDREAQTRLYAASRT
ncbi:CocE/NonD family hydrolase, partial [Nguyenibacter vanlangensis]